MYNIEWVDQYTFINWTLYNDMSQYNWYHEGAD